MARKPERIEPRLTVHGEPPTLNDPAFISPAPRTYRAERGVAGKITLTAICIAALIGGWHFICDSALNQRLSRSLSGMSQNLLPGSSTVVTTNPVSNLVVVRVTRSSLGGGLVDLIADGVIEEARVIIEDRLERELQIHARAAIDVYAMALPYKISISVEVGKPASAGVINASPQITQLLERYSIVNSKCRGLPYPEHESWCEERDRVSGKLEKNGWCYGEGAEYGYQKRWAPCR